jgi:hypothetical protein
MDDNSARCRRGDYDPSPYEIAARCAEIRAGWDAATELKRRAIGRRIAQRFPEMATRDLGVAVDAIESFENPWV